MLDFLSRVLSPAGFVCVASPNQYKGFNHFATDDKGKLKWMIGMLVEEQKDVYFALGTLKEKSIVDAAGKKRVRVAENISSLKAFFLDLDVGETKAYKTQLEAIKHLAKFRSECGLPNPIVVSSGYGVHAYWPMTQQIGAETWRRCAGLFKALTVAYGLHADPVRTADSSSVLRVPGTLNFKDRSAPREVKILNTIPAPDTDPKTFMAIVAAASKQFNAKPVTAPTPSAPQVDTGLGSFEVAGEPAEFKDVVKKCQQIHQAVAHQETTAEPVWYATLQVVRHCKDAEKMALVVSHKHPGYDKDATLLKMQQMADKNVGPTLCDTFDSRNPGGCNGCEHRGKIKSPIVLGRVLKEADDKPTMVIDHGNGESSTIELPKPPYPYMRTTSGAIAIRVKDENGKEIDPEVIYDFDIHPTRRMYDELEQTEVIWFRSWLPQDGWQEYPVPAYLVYDSKKMMELLGRRGVLPDMAQKDRLVGYMLAYIQNLQRQMPADQIYSQFGWRKDDREIIIGNRRYTKDGMKPVKINEQFNNVVPKFDQKGDLAVWRQVANLYNREGYEDYAFALMMGFGQLVFKFFGYEGSIFNLHGDGGAGKSTVLKMIHSIYGIPTEKSLLHQDTNNAKLAVIGCYNNLPVTYDEITNIEPWELSDLCYAMSNGRGKEALKQDRSLRSNTTTWQTTMFCTSNAPLVPKLTNLKGTGSGETLRILERAVRKQSIYSLAEARELLNPLDSNYGLAGGVIAEWLVKNVDAARKLAQDTYRTFCDRVEAQSPERFWSAMCAQAIVGAKIGQMLGLHDYSPEAIEAHAERIILETRGGMILETKTPVDLLVEYMNQHITDTIVITHTPNGMADVVREPKRTMMIRHELDTARIWITKGHIRNWCVEHNHDLQVILDHLQERGVLLADNTNKCLGDETEFITGRSQCYLIAADSKIVTGAVSLTAVKTA
jgi:hypothetical protein